MRISKFSTVVFVFLEFCANVGDSWKSDQLASGPWNLLPAECTSGVVSIDVAVISLKSVDIIESSVWNDVSFVAGSNEYSTSGIFEFITRDFSGLHAEQKFWKMFNFVSKI